MAARDASGLQALADAPRLDVFIRGCALRALGIRARRAPQEAPATRTALWTSLRAAQEAGDVDRLTAVLCALADLGIEEERRPAVRALFERGLVDERVTSLADVFDPTSHDADLATATIFEI
ncbi:MAG TPA: hypothetical protein VHF22_14670, partial [Planctomycetota bacterium]|nr:hypothetical protein [Planctomycetota bacterium]